MTSVLYDYEDSPASSVASPTAAVAEEAGRYTNPRRTGRNPGPRSARANKTRPGDRPPKGLKSKRISYRAKIATPQTTRPSVPGPVSARLPLPRTSTRLLLPPPCSPCR